MMSSSLLGKRRLAATGRIDLTTIVLCVSFCLVLLIHQITLSSLTKKSSSSSSSNANSTATQAIPSELNTVERKADIIAPQQRQPSEAALPVLQLISCDRTHKRYDICSLNGPTIMDPTKSTFHVLDSSSTTSSLTVSQKIRPYPRKWETNLVCSHIKELTLLATSSSQLENVHCDIHHRNPALVFSSGGYTGNPYHDFDDGFIPLFITLRTAYPSSEEQPILVISKCEDWWLSKYSELLEMFSPYPIINLDNETSTHCFPSATVGLISHGFMTIDPTLLPNPETLRDFRALLESAYAKTGLQTNPTISALSASTPTPRPRLLVVSRTGENVGRVMSNQAQVVLLAKEIGFDVTVFEPTKFTSVTETYRLINSAHAMMGVHGAAMTNLLFLRPGSIFMQVVPIGTDWAAEVCYGKPAKEIGLDYMEYKIKVNESTLVDKYGKDSMVVKDPKSVSKKDWSIIKKIYLTEQNVRVNLVRFEKHLRKAYKKAKKFMDKVG